MEEIVELICKRRSIHRYQAKPVEREKLIGLLQAAMAAPTACNSQPWEFVVVTEPEVLDQLRSRLRFGQYNAPAAIVVCGNTSIAHNSAGARFWEQDCSAATENILLAAVGMGLGAVWLGVHPIPSIEKSVREALNIPENATPLCVVYVGYPDEEKPPRTQYNEHRVHWQEYEPRKKQLKIKNAKELP